nr:uncharacterized protein LOC128688314 isoform X6 [Cherax quadricarinatus]
MRRPSFCCEQHGAAHTKCQPQEGGESTLSRVRRFLAVSMGGRSSSSCKHHTTTIPPDPLHAPAHAVHSLLADMKGAGVGVQGILGRPLDEVMAAHGEDTNSHGVPTLVHLLCCFLLTHGVDYDTLVSENWCAEEVRTRLLLEREAAGVDPEVQDTPPGSDSAVATGLLRLFLDELPHPLLPPEVAPLLLQMATDSGVGERRESEGLCGGSGGGEGGANESELEGGGGEVGGVGGGGEEGPPGLCVAVVPRLRRLLHRRVPVHNLCLLRYLAAFIHQLRTGNHNTCPVAVVSLSRVLARVVIAPDDKETQGQAANRLGELLILCYTDIFQSNEEIADDTDDLSDSGSSPGSVGDSREDGLDDEDEDEADTTTTDTDDFRSPPVSPLKVDTPLGPTTLRGSPSLPLHPPTLPARSNKEVVGDLDTIRSKVPTYTKDSGSHSQSTEEEKTPSYLSSLTSDDEPTRYDPVPPEVSTCELGLRGSQQRPSGFSELVDASEPVTSDRGSWGMRGAAHTDPFHRTAPRYSRFDDEDSAIQSSWYRSDEDDTVISPRVSRAFINTGAPQGRDDNPPPGQSAVKILMKNINSIKKRIKRYEEEFEASFGYRPSHSEKMKHKEIKKYMSELSKARKELKQMKDGVAGLVSVPTVFPLSLLRCQESTNPGARPAGSSSSTAGTLRHVEDRLREKRSLSGRPAELTNMSCVEMQEEKTALQKALLYYEAIHGRPTTREDRDLVRPLYDRYRQVKRIVVRSSSRTKENLAELPPIIEHVAMDFTLASPQHRSSLQGDEIEKLIPAAPNTPPGFDSPPTFDSSQAAVAQSDDPKDGQRSVALGDLHALPLSELRERKKEAREEKKKLRRLLREYEEKFEREMGRKVQKEDRGPMEQTYLDYKHAKAKLRLLEALLSKHEPLKV